MKHLPDVLIMVQKDQSVSSDISSVVQNGARMLHNTELISVIYSEACGRGCRSSSLVFFSCLRICLLTHLPLSHFLFLPVWHDSRQWMYKYPRLSGSLFCVPLEPKSGVYLME
jgi:hypothetical protein